MMPTGGRDWRPLASLTTTERDAVIAAATRRRYTKGDIVFTEGDRSDSIHLVVSGHLAVKVSTPDGETATLNVVGPGAWFGELSMVADQGPVPRSATLVVLDEAETLMLTETVFRALCAQHPRIERLVVELMAMRLRDISTRLLSTMYVALDRRVAGCLVDLARIYPAPKGPVVIPLRQEDLAEMVGGTRPSVNQVLRGLVADGVIELGRGRVTLLDLAELESRSGL